MFRFSKRFNQAPGLTLILASLSLPLAIGCSDDNLAGEGTPDDADAGKGDAGNSDAGDSDAGDSDAGNSDAGNSDAGNSESLHPIFIDTTAAYSALRQCGLLSDGPSTPIPYSDHNRCQIKCWEEAVDCTELTDIFCGDGEEACLQECFAFSCDGERGIPEEWVCDGGWDCDDGSDEQACDGELFECSTYERVPQAFRCDGDQDCENGADEENCAKLAVFTCEDGSTIPLRWRCDGSLDCDSGDFASSDSQDISDEQDCPYPTIQQCDDGNGYYSIGWRCDDEVDCADGSDEPANCPVKTCSE